MDSSCCISGWTTERFSGREIRQSAGIVAGAVHLAHAVIVDRTAKSDPKNTAQRYAVKLRNILHFKMSKIIYTKPFLWYNKYIKSYEMECQI